MARLGPLRAHALRLQRAHFLRWPARRRSCQRHIPARMGPSRFVHPALPRAAASAVEGGTGTIHRSHTGISRLSACRRPTDRRPVPLIMSSPLLIPARTPASTVQTTNNNRTRTLAFALRSRCHSLASPHRACHLPLFSPFFLLFFSFPLLFFSHPHTFLSLQPSSCKTPRSHPAKLARTAAVRIYNLSLFEFLQRIFVLFFSKPISRR